MQVYAWVHWPVYVYTDVPAEKRDISVEKILLHDLHNASVLHDSLNTMPTSDPTVLSTDNHLTMLFEGSTVQQRLKLRVLRDTGASANFVSPRILQQLKLSTEPVAAKLRLADNSETAIIGKVKLKLKLQHFVATVLCFVTDLCQDFDVVLGNTLLVGNKAVLNFEHHTVSLTRDGKLYQLRAATSAAEPDRNVKFDGSHDDRQFLSCAQASRCMNNGCDSYLIVVITVQTETDAQPDTALSDSIAALRHKYADIFEPPAGLPPDRGTEHVIP